MPGRLSIASTSNRHRYSHLPLHQKALRRARQDALLVGGHAQLRQRRQVVSPHRACLYLHKASVSPSYSIRSISADCPCTVKVDCSTLSHGSITCSGSPEVSSIAFHAQPPDLPPVPLMDMGFVVLCRFARHRRPQIRFLSIGSRVCSTLPSDLLLRLGPCASLSLHVHQDE